MEEDGAGEEQQRTRAGVGVGLEECRATTQRGQGKPVGQAAGESHQADRESRQGVGQRWTSDQQEEWGMLPGVSLTRYL